jgi:nicotinamide riboside kinase
MKIALSGTQCVGKTTVLNQIERLPFFDTYAFYKGSKTQEIKDYGLSHSEDANEYTQIIILSNMIKDAHLNEYLNSVTDRCILDNLVYSKYLFDRKKISEELFKVIYNSCLDLIKKYDFIFVLQPNIKLVSNNYRSLDEQYRLDINEIFNYYINHFAHQGIYNIIKVEQKENVDRINFMIKKIQETPINQ